MPRSHMLSRISFFIALTLLFWGTPHDLQGFEDDFFLTSQCRALFAQRRERLEMIRKAKILAAKNETLLKSTPPQKKQLKTRLERLRLKIERELASNQKKLQQQEEQLIMKGCPPFQRD